jgi:hypothetical protein
LGDEEGGKVDDFGGREEVGRRRERHAFFWHAVETSEVTALCDADPEIVMLATERVCEKGRKRFGGFERGAP